MMTKQIPDTRRAQLYRKLLGALYVMAISGITLVLSSITSDLMDAGFNVGQLDAKTSVVNAILLTGSGLMCWMSYRGSRRNLMPPSWGIMTIVALVWAAILLNRLA